MLFIVGMLREISAVINWEWCCCSGCFVVFFKQKTAYEIRLSLVGSEMCFFFQAEDGIRDAQESRGLGDVYKGQFYEALVPHDLVCFRHVDC